MLLVLLDVIHNVQFRECTNVEREEWSTFDPQELIVQGGADFHFVRFIGGYLHSNILQSSTLNEFFDDLLWSVDALSDHFQQLLTVPRSTAVVGNMSVIYCFLAHSARAPPSKPVSDVHHTALQESLLEILTEFQQGPPEDQI
jgi:hypothetical protein